MPKPTHTKKARKTKTRFAGCVPVPVEYWERVMDVVAVANPQLRSDIVAMHIGEARL